MNYQQYHELFDTILNDSQPTHPYDDEHFLNYTKLNQSRMKRWDKQLVLSDGLIAEIAKINKPQHWIIITEPWCGDAAHILPFLIRMSLLNEFVSYDIQLRDSEPFLINAYLTNGSKSIPKLIVRDNYNNDQFNWGSRPLPAQQLLDKMKTEGATMEIIKLGLQYWYNEDKGRTLCSELEKLF